MCTREIAMKRSELTGKKEEITPFDLNDPTTQNLCYIIKQFNFILLFSIRNQKTNMEL